jgi:hypothetical protein
MEFEKSLEQCWVEVEEVELEVGLLKQQKAIEFEKS